MLVSGFGQTYFIALFAGFIQSDLGLSHGEWGSMYTFATIGSAAVMLWAGTLTDQYRVRSLVPVVLGVFATAAFWMSQANATWMLIPMIFILRLMGQGMLSHIASVATSRWFVTTRGKALSLASLGYAAGESMIPIAVVFAFAFVGWQAIWVVATLVILGAIPILMRLLKTERTPQSIVMQDQSEGMLGKHWTRVEVLRHPLFWIMAPVVMGPPSFITAFIFHQVHYAEVLGFAHIQLVQFFPLFTATTILATMISGWALDKFGTARLLPYHQIPCIAAFACFAMVDSVVWMGAGFAFMGLTAGAGKAIPTAFWAEFFGTRHLGAIKSMAAAIMVLGSALGPGITGYLIDAGVPLMTQYWCIAGYFALMTVLMLIAFTIVQQKNLLPRTS